MTGEYVGPERRRLEENPSTVQVLEAVKLLSKQYEDNSEANRALAREVRRRKTEGRLFALGAVVIAAIIVVGGLVIRHNDRTVEAERRRQLAAQVVSQRDNQVQGCERGNDQRRTLAEVIVRSIRPSDTPSSVTDPELLALIEQGRQRTLALRSELLSLPGVQIVDCQEAYPPVTLPER